MFDCQCIVVFDTEWTSWTGFRESRWTQPGRYREIVQIGAIALEVEAEFREIDSFQILVQPKKNPVLREFFIELTGITQNMVDADGVGFPEALASFMNFAEQEPVQFASFGKDEKVVEANCNLCELPMPIGFADSVDIRQEFLDRNIIEEFWFSSELPHRLGLPPVGKAHDALADSRALAAALRHIGNRLE